MKALKRIAALALALLMAASMPIIALAEGTDANFTLTINNEKLYANMSYDIIAKITDVSESEAADNSSFKWSISSTSGNATINSKNNFEKTLNADGQTYTVTESATFIMPQAGAEVTITAGFASRSKQAVKTSYQPIESYDYNIENNEHCYFDANSETLYIDRSTKQHEYAGIVKITNELPADNEDRVTANVSGFAFDKYTLETGAEDNSISLSFSDSATGRGTLNLITESGKTPKFMNVQCCVEATKYTLNYKKAGDKTAVKLYTQQEEEETTVDFPSNIAVEGKAFEITATDFSSNANDFIDYTLYTDEGLTNKAASTYYTKTGNNCELSINVAGTYYLECVNRSCDNGMLKRTLGKVIVKIIVSKAYPIQSIELFELDENGDKTDKKLESITLYTDTSNETKTYQLAKSVTVNPLTNTDTLTYESTNAAVAKVDATTGLITAVGKGNATVWAKSTDNANAAAPLKVEVKKGIKSLSGITTEEGTVEIPSGHVKQLKVTVNPTDAEQEIFWSTSNPDVLSVDAKTGVATAKEVTSPISVTVYAATKSNVTTSTPIQVVPAKRASSVKIDVSGNSDTFEVDESGTYPVYKDYNLAKPKRVFTVSAEALAADSGESNDEILWNISYDNGPGMSFEEAQDLGYITYSPVANAKNTFNITLLKTEPFNIICTATTNVTAPQGDDPYDMAVLKLNEVAQILTLINENTAKELSNNANINLPIGGKVAITAIATTSENSKTDDPPIIQITQGAEYINVTSTPSLDGEGITYTIEGLKYGSQISKIKFSSKSGSQTKTINFTVRNNLSDATVEGISDMPYNNGTAITFPNVVLKMNGSSIPASQYSVAYSNNKDAGTATITFTGKDTYIGSVKVVNFKIVPLTLDEAIVGDIKDLTLSDRTAVAEPKPSVKVGTKTLSNNRDYTLSYLNNTTAGKATVVITGTGNYTGVAYKTFNILDTLSRCTVSKIAMQTYSGKSLRPVPTITYMGRKLVYNTDFTVTYTNNVNVGTATAKIEGKGFFKGSVSQTFVIRPKKVAIKKPKAGKKSLTIKWGTQANVSGYQVQYALNKNFTKKAKSVYVTGIGSYKATKLKKKKKYYVRVRSYITINGVKIYGAWSDVKSKKTK